MKICSNKKCGPYKGHSFVWRELLWCSPWCAKHPGEEYEGIKHKLFGEKKKFKK